MSKTTERLLQIGILTAVGLMITCGISVALFSLNRMKNHDRLIQSQIEYNQALKENIGKPQIIEQRYFSPNTKDK